MLIFFTLMPPFEAGRKLLKLHRRGLGVALSAFGERLIVIPDILRRAGAIEEKKIGGNACIWSKYAVRKSHDSVKVEVLEEFLLDASTNAVAEEDAVRDDHATPAYFRPRGGGAFA